MTVQVKLSSNGLVKITGTSEPLRATLLDSSDSPLSDMDVKFTINGVTYTRTTNSNGVASLNINLPVGSYPTTIAFEGTATYGSKSISVTVTVNPKNITIMSVSNYTKNYGEAGALRCKLLKTDTTPLPGRGVHYTINGVEYTRVTDSNGIASLNINLPVGEYWTKVEFPGDETQDSVMYNVTVKVKSHTWMKGEDVSKMEDETKVYSVGVYNAYNQRLECDVSMKVNGVTYVRHTDENGFANLNIRLPAGEYKLTATFNGDDLNNKSSTINNIYSIPYRKEVTSNYGGVTYPSNNRGFVQSKVIVKQWSHDTAKARDGVTFWDDTGQLFHREINFESYEITETDPRVKTAKFVTPEYFDLTRGQLWCYISSPYHENFGGRILKVDFDKDTGLYTYQCQDGRRLYMSKTRTTSQSAIIYDIIEALLVKPYYPDNLSFPISDELRQKHWKILSGLRPVDDYAEQLSPVIKGDNQMKVRVDALSYDSLMDKIMNFAHYGQNITDVHFSPEGVCQLEPVDIDKWVKTGLLIRHSDLTQYKYGFDTTNILTGVNVQSQQAYKIKDNDKDDYINNIYGDLANYFGASIGMISPSTTTVTTEGTGTSSPSSSGGSATGANKGKTIVVGCDTNVPGSDAAWRDTTANKLRSAGYNVETLSVGSNYFADYDWYGASRGKVGVYLMADSTVSIADYACHNGFDYAVFGIRGDAAPKAVREWTTAKWRPDGDCNSVCNAWAYKTGQEKDDMLNSRGRGRVVKGSSAEELANVILAAVNGEANPNGSTSGDTSTSQSTTTTVIDEAGTYQKALEKMVESTRKLLSFEIKLPFNDKLFKDVHTNQLLWTELPTDFKLANLDKIFKILPTHKISRGVAYQQNRWYIEKLVTKCDGNGVMGTLTLNPFPSSYSAYANAVKEYAKAYDQAFRQKTEDNKGTSSSGGSGPGEPRLGNDSTETSDIACATGRYRGHAGDNENFDNCAKRGYAQQGRNYYNWARQFKSPIELAKALNDMYSEVTHYNHWDDNADVTFNKGWGNCWDGCRMVKCCFDAAGFDCVVITGEMYGWGHGWNAIKHNGRWYTFDLLFDYTSAGDWAGTNTIRMAHEW